MIEKTKKKVKKKSFGETTVVGSDGAGNENVDEEDFLRPLTLLQDCRGELILQPVVSLMPSEQTDLISETLKWK